MGERSLNSDQRLPKNEIIKKNNEFKTILSRGRQWEGKYIKIFTLEAKERKVGFLVPKKVGNAVIRNRIKRLMREIYRKNRQNINNMHLVLYAKNLSYSAGYQHIYNDFHNFLKSKNDI